MTPRLFRVGAAGVFVMFVMLLSSHLAAHMKAAKSEPTADATVTASPKQVQVWFTQAPDPKLSKLEMSGPSGPIALTGFQVTKDKSIMATIAASLADARYTVRWQSAGDDGHVQKGEFTFTVRQAR